MVPPLFIHDDCNEEIVQRVLTGKAVEKHNQEIEQFQASRSTHVAS